MMNTGNLVPSESTEQIWLFQWAAQMARIRWPELDLLFHCPNGGKRSAIAAARFKAEGVKAGVPDIVLPVPRCGYHGLFIELKRQSGGKVSVYQKAYLDALRAQGYCAEVCKGFHAAADLIERYMKGELISGEG